VVRLLELTSLPFTSSLRCCVLHVLASSLSYELRPFYFTPNPLLSSLTVTQVDLIGRFNPIAQGLDIVELAAIFACVPEKFVNDPTGKKNQWRLNLENALREMDKQRQEGKLPASKARNPCYKKQVIAPFMHRKTMRINEVVLSGLAYDQEFSSKSHVMEQ
jgi:hypothetical protein